MPRAEGDPHGALDMGTRGPKPDGVIADPAKGFDAEYKSDIKPIPEEPPSNLDGNAKIIWRELHRKGSTGHLTASDIQAFARYCSLASQVADLEKRATKEDPKVFNRELPMKNPIYTLLDSYRKTFLSYSKSLGLTPDSRKAKRPGDIGDNLRDSPNNFDEHS